MAIVERLKHDIVDGLRVGRLRFRMNTSSIVYCVGRTAIDTGPANQWRWVRRFLTDHRVSRILLTHHHEDHAGNAARCQQELGLPVFSSALCQTLAEKKMNLPPHRKLCWGTPEPFSAQVIDETMTLEQGLVLRAIPCSGHADDMVCYLEPNRGWLFAGDLYLAPNTKYMLKEENPHLMIDSLNKVLEYPFDTLFCSHRGIVHQGHRALKQKLDFLLSTLETVRKLSKSGLNEQQITRTLLGREDWMSLLTMYHFSKQNFINRLLDEPRKPN